MHSFPKSCYHFLHPLDKLYGGKGFVEERHRHRYEVNPEYVPQLEEKGLKFVGKSTDLQRMEVLEMKTEGEEGRGGVKEGGGLLCCGGVRCSHRLVCIILSFSICNPL